VTWFVFVLMCLAAYRLTRLIVKDTFPPVLWLRDRLVGGWRPLTEPEQAQTLVRLQSIADTQDDPEFGQLRMINFKTSRYLTRKPWSPYWLAELLSCPWCASAYVSGGLTAAVDVFYGVPVPWLVGPAVWAVSAVLASREWA
jgi:hypothetical protein